MLRLATLASALLLVACADSGDEGMIVRNNTAVADTCTLTGEPGQPFKSRGTIYAFSPAGYLLTPLIESRIALSVGDEQMVDPLQKTIQLRGADVSLTLKSVSVETNGSFNVQQLDQALGTPFSTLFAAPLPPNGSVNVGFEVIPPSLLREAIAASGADPNTSNINAEVLAQVTIRGELGGDELTSAPFHYPISVCNNCVVVDNGACPMNVAEVRIGDPCNVFQDGQVDCCRDEANNLICPGTVGQL